MSISQSKSEAYHHGALRDALITAAVETLKREGMDALSLRKLARDAGVSHNAPYMHFADKEALLAAIAAEGFVLLADKIREALARHTDGWHGRLAAACCSYVTFVLAHSGHAQVMFRNYDSSVYPDTSQAAVNALDLLESIILEGQNLGFIRAGDSRQMAGLTWSLVHGIATISAANKMPPSVLGGLSVEALTERFIDQLMAGLRP